MKKILSLLFLSMGFSVLSHAQIDTLYISNLYTTHIVFTTDLTYADLSNTSNIAAKIIEQNKNMLALKARTPFTSTASVTALESNGEIHTYIIAFKAHPKELIYDTREKSKKGLIDEGGSDAEVKEKGGKKFSTKKDVVSNLRKEDAPSLEDVINAPQQLFHIASRSGKIEFVCENVFAYSDITYITLSLNNRSGVSYETGDATFVIESRNKSKRKIIYEQSIFPKNRYGTLTVASHSKGRISYTLDKLTLAPDQVLKIYLYENTGRRNLILTLSPDDVNQAKNPF